MAKGLTPHQERIWSLHQEKKSNMEVATEIGISANNVAKTLTIIRKKLGVKGSQKLEDKDPEKVAMLVEALSVPNITKEQVAVILGYKSADHINPKMLERIVNAHHGVIQQKKRMNLEQLKAMLEDQLFRANRYMTDEKLAEASARDLAVAQAAWIEKLQLLKGEPTAIISNHERKQLLELGPLMLQELQRRGITIEGQAKDVTSEPVGA